MSDYAGAISRQGNQLTARLILLSSFLLWLALLIVFNRFPAIDLTITRGFFTEASCGVLGNVARICGQFSYDKMPLFSTFRSVLYALPYIAVVILLISIIAALLRRDGRSITGRIDMSIAALISLALGCGLFVNLFLKAFSGRPRPRQTALFGGDLDFVQAGSFAGKCLSNCSFISGESSSSGWLFCLIVLVPARWRLAAGVPLAIVSFAVPVLRVMTGAHYLSDAVLGWLSSVVVFSAVLAIMEIRRGSNQPPVAKGVA